MIPLTSMTTTVPDNGSNVPDNTVKMPDSSTKMPDSEQEQLIYEYVLEEQKSQKRKIAIWDSVSPKFSRSIIAYYESKNLFVNVT